MSEKRKLENISEYLKENFKKNNILNAETIMFGDSNYFSIDNLKKTFLRKFFGFETVGKLEITKFKLDNEINIFSMENDIKKKAQNILNIKFNKIENSYPRIYSINIEYVAGTDTHFSNGASFISHKEAMRSCFGEYLERYNLYFNFNDQDYKLKNKPETKFINKKNILNKIKNSPSLLKSQNNHKNHFFISEIENIEVGKMYNEISRKNELLPVECAYYFPKKINANNFLFQATTNGGGGGTTVEMAKLSGIYELIERDNFLLYWLSGISPDQINIETMPEELKNKVMYFEKRYKLKFYFLNTTYDTEIFSCTVVCVDELTQKICVAAACNSDTDKTLEKAFAECISLLRHIESGNIFNEKFLENYNPFNQEIDRKTRINFYNNSFGVSVFKNLFLKGTEINYEDIKNKYDKSFKNQKKELVYLINIFKKLSLDKGVGYNLYTKEHDGKLLNSFDYYVIKAFVPDFMKLWLSEEFATPWSERLVDFADQKGIPNFTKENINILPHPFP